MEQPKKQLDPLYQIAEIELVYKSKVKASDRPQITEARDAFKILFNTWDHNKIDLVEQFKVLLLNRANKVLGIIEVSSGGLTGTVADPRIILAAGIKAAAVSLIICHNHPSGNLRPSKADEQLTQKIKEAGYLLDIKLLDHLIITGDETYFSFADEGLL